MQTSQRLHNIHRLYHQPKQDVDTYFFTLESSVGSSGDVACYSPAISNSSNHSPFPPQGSQTGLCGPRHSSDNSLNRSSVDDNARKHELGELETNLLGPESDTLNSFNCCFGNAIHQTYHMASWQKNSMAEMTARLDLTEALLACAQAVFDNNITSAIHLMHVLEQNVSVSGTPMQRLGAYMLEGLRARLESSGSQIYKALKCKEPTSSELMSYMSFLYQVCPYWKFAYVSANVIIGEVMENEPRIHIIDFQIAQGSQWMLLIPALATRPGGPPSIRITGIDDSQSAYARGGGLYVVEQRLSKLAASLDMPFEFHGVGSCGPEFELEDLMIRPGEALAVNFPYVLHHLPDESVSTRNHRDRLLRLVKSLSPKVMTLVEQESNTNTSPFMLRFRETLDYYKAMFESIDASALAREDKQRINAEQNCVARDIVNMIACEEAERVERHELLGKWRSRLMMAGFSPLPLSSSVSVAVKDFLKEYSRNYRVEKKDDALYLGWKDRDMATSSAWR